MLDEVREALRKNTGTAIREVYPKVFGRQLAKSCTSCLKDARYELQIWMEQEERAKSDIVLFINQYESPNKRRNEELKTVLFQNQSNPLISKIVNVEGRKYSDFFRAMSDYPDTINIIANSDIFFDDTLAQCKKISGYQAYALTRWEYANGKAQFLNRQDSQDVWIIRGVPKGVYGELSLGVPGCDNRIAYELKQKYIVSNPSLTIRSYHLHLSKFFTYKPTDKIPEPYLFLPPCKV